MAIRNVSELAAPLYIGSGSDRVKIDTDGTTTLEGDATVWEDLREPMSGKNLYANPGKADFDFDEGWVVLEENGSLSTQGDVIFANFQLPHATKVDSSADLHIHWNQTTETSRTISGKYRIQNNGTTPTTAWTAFTATCTEAGNNVFPWAVGGVVQITDLTDIDLTGVGLSSVIQVRIARTDTNASNDMYVLYMDLHVEIDSFGSKEEYVK